MPSTLTHPTVIHPGNQYLLRYPSASPSESPSRLVTLVRFTVCLAVVIVEDARQRHFPCDRLWLVDLDAVQLPDNS